MLKQRTPLKAKTPLKSKTPLKKGGGLKTYKPLQAKTGLKTNKPLQAKTGLKTYKPLQAKTGLKTYKPLQPGNSSLKRTQLVSKPKQTPERTSIVFSNLKVCCMCGRHEDLAKGVIIHKHEIFFGRANRSKSIEDHMIAPLCQWCHEDGENAVHRNKIYDNKLKVKAQAVWEDNYKKENQANDEEARKAFIARFGKSWLE